MASTKTPNTADLKQPTNKASTTVAVRPAGNVVSIAEQLKAQAAAMGERTAPPGGNKIRVTQDKKFILPNGQTTAGPIDVCIVDFRAIHNFWEEKFDPKNIKPVACFAIATNPKGMVPSNNAPLKQDDGKGCDTCPMNAFGSEGTGKACKEGRRLALLPASDDGLDVDHEADLWTIDVSPTAIKGFDSYVQGVARTFGQPPVAFLTEVAFDESQTYAKLVFSNPRPVVSIGDALARQAEAKEILEVEPDVSNFVSVASAPKAAARKVASARR